MISHLKNVLATFGIKCVMKKLDLISAAGELPPIECWPELWVVEDDKAKRARRFSRKLWRRWRRSKSAGFARTAVKRSKDNSPNVGTAAVTVPVSRRAAWSNSRHAPAAAESPICSTSVRSCRRPRRSCRGRCARSLFPDRATVRIDPSNTHIGVVAMIGAIKHDLAETDGGAKQQKTDGFEQTRGDKWNAAPTIDGQTTWRAWPEISR